MTITEFLEARIAEDEAVARSATNAPWDLRGGNEWLFPFGFSIGSDDDIRGADADHIARHDPARILAECAAKRVFMAEWQRVVVEHRRAYGVEPSSPVIAAFAAVYKDHPDYRQDWAL